MAKTILDMPLMAIAIRFQENQTKIKQVLVSIILQKNIAKVSSSTLKSVEVGVEVLKKAKIKFVPAAASRLEEKGVVFVRLVDDAGVERYSAVYKGEVIVFLMVAQRS